MRNVRKAILISFLLILLLGCNVIVFYPGKFADVLGLYGDTQSGFPAMDILDILKQNDIHKPLKHPVLRVSKSKCMIALFEGETKIKTYTIAMGKNYMDGNKQREGDKRTPEGRYFIAKKQMLFLPHSYLGSRWMHISYPNSGDAKRGLKTGAITIKEFKEIITAVNNENLPPQSTALGGEIGIHGGHKPKKSNNWTEGCIAMFNRDIEELYEYVPVGTLIIIEE